MSRSLTASPGGSWSSVALRGFVNTALLSPTSPSVTSPSGVTVTSPASEIRSVETSSRLIWRLFAPRCWRCRSRCPSSSSWRATLRRLVLELVLRGVGRAAASEADRRHRGDHHDADRDAGHGQDEAACAASAGSWSRRSYGGGAVHPVPDAAHRRDRARVAELLAHLRDVHVDGAHVAEPVVAPDAVEDLLTAEREARPLREEAQQVELLGGEVDRGVVDRGSRAGRRRS